MKKLIALVLFSLFLLGCASDDCGDNFCDRPSETDSNCPQDCEYVPPPVVDLAKDCGSDEECFKDAIISCTEAKIIVSSEGSGTIGARVIGDSDGFCKVKIDIGPPSGVENPADFECTYFGFYFESTSPVNFIADENPNDFCRDFVNSLISELLI